ncbi:GntR family transcriptional regulator [Bacillus nakamurai]|uniref:GntR family transcriptional regulator n=1 Tax=Bacillus nakamurai TaxID=1793963 RepID=UPI001E39D1DA|nr:GntR family transcriptional regulator [Bacillus nakamurai]MCC9024366.1 GntR family transcriptional regulator [Bacillus nakamurai]MCP6684031.1 GntR family transcriptional regulator [Bacillus nakamurai]
MDNFKLDKPTPYYLQFYSQLKKMIFDGTFKPGERLNETQLAKDFGVSRSPIREAMRLLEKDGLLTADDRNGFVIYSLSVKDVEEIYKIRMSLESLAVELVIDEAADSELQLIEKQLQDTEEAINTGVKEAEIIALNETFHHLLVDFSHNSHLAKLLEHVNVLIHFCRVLNFKGDNRAAVILNEHRKVFEEMKKGNKTKAVQYMTDHLQHDLEHLKGVLKEKEADR